ncbi:hypothetical protein [Bdellovibrio svalbardensis]|uniref:Lipoprotein n=1 Tax=Bdellovibrio svalbardensis TaxID=2972972 RepID=A0ABT6DDK5_9BACT|nr:hypothetical protein [Bdellovibrio svalbardensis]MDG0814898.1 hypothetical protein [Bdellovibrio svalbardensis]
MKNTNFNKSVIGVLTLLAVVFHGSGAIAGCKMSRDPKMNYFISYENKALGMFSEAAEKAQAPSVIERCQLDSGKFLMLSLGVRRPTLNSDVADVSFDGQLIDTKCSIENSFFKEQPDYSERSKIIEQQHKVLRTCTYMQIFDLDNKPIEFKPEQSHCKITRMPTGSLKAEGDFCFVRIRPINRFAVSTVVKDECRDVNFLKANNIAPQDVEAALNAYVVGDDSGLSTEVDPIGSTKTRLYIAPHSKMLNLSDDFGADTPRFPTEFNADVHMGELKIRGSKETFTVDMSLLVNNRSQKSCYQGMCASPSDFDVPVVGQVELFEVQKGGKENYIDAWWHAGLANPNWQGLMKSGPHVLNETELKPGTHYRMTVTFVDPAEDFTLFIKDIQQMTIDLKGLQGTAGLDSIAPIMALTSLVGLPPMENLPSMSSPNMEVEMERVLKTLQKLGQDRQWPSYYNDVCNSKRASCIKAGKSKFYSKLTLDFTMGDFNIETGSWDLNSYTVKRESPVFGNYTVNPKALPTVSCEVQ